jgi:hypothetical protein
MWLRSEINHSAEKQAVLRAEWIRFHRLLEENHLALAHEHAEAAMNLELEEASRS